MPTITATEHGQTLDSPPIVGAASIPAVRYHYLDNLRALAMLAGVLLHAGLAYSVIFHELWPTADNQQTPIADYGAWLLHTFRMPLFFLIAGFFAHFLIQKRGLKGFIINRALRVTLPFIIFWPIMLTAIISLLIYAAQQMDVHTPIIELFRQAMANPEAMEGQQPPLSTTHLWFLYYLSMYCVAAALLYKFLPIGKAAYHWLTSPIFLLAVFPVCTAISLLQKFIPHPAPESVVPEFWALCFYGLFFAVGWAMLIKTEFLQEQQKLIPYLCMSSVIAAGVFISQLPEPFTLQDAHTVMIMHQLADIDLTQLLRTGSTGILAWHLTLLCLLLGYRYLNSANAVLKYIADGSYWVYIVHLPIVFYLQLQFHTLSLPIITEFLLVCALTLGISYLSYAIFVRHTPLGWLLNGRKKSKT